MKGISKPPNRVPLQVSYRQSGVFFAIGSVGLVVANNHAFSHCTVHFLSAGLWFESVISQHDTGELWSVGAFCNTVKSPSSRGVTSTWFESGISKNDTGALCNTVTSLHKYE